MYEKYDEFDAIENNFGIKTHEKNDGTKCKIYENIITSKHKKHTLIICVRYKHVAMKSTKI